MLLSFALISPALRGAPDPFPALERLEALGLDLQGDGFASAVALKQRNVIDLMLRAGVSPNLCGADGRTPLFHAAAAGDDALVVRLLAAGADPNLADEQRVAPIMVATVHGMPALLEILLKAGANVNAVDGSGRTALHYALAAKQLPTVERLLAENPRLDARSCDERDAFAVAVETRDEKILAAIFARVTQREWDLAGRNLLQRAVDSGDVEKVRFVLSKHIGPPSPEGCRDPLLAYAVAANDIKLAQLLLDAGADPNTALEGPAEPRFLEYTTAKPLRNYLAEVPGVTVLMIAAGMGNNELVKLLIERGAERLRTTTGKYRMLALYFAAWGGHAECLQTLLGNAPSPEQIRIEISLAAQRATLFRDGAPVFKTGISTGRKGFATPTGRFVITDKKSSHISTIYKVPMPFFMRLSCRDFGMHQGVVPDYPASHGCIRLPSDAARKLFREVPVGTLVTITN